jgi:hypothetical protein
MLSIFWQAIRLMGPLLPHLKSGSNRTSTDRLIAFQVAIDLTGGVVLGNEAKHASMFKQSFQSSSALGIGRCQSRGNIRWLAGPLHGPVNNGWASWTSQNTSRFFPDLSSVPPPGQSTQKASPMGTGGGNLRPEARRRST